MVRLVNGEWVEDGGTTGVFRSRTAEQVLADRGASMSAAEAGVRRRAGDPLASPVRPGAAAGATGGDIMDARKAADPFTQEGVVTRIGDDIGEMSGPEAVRRTGEIAAYQRQGGAPQAAPAGAQGADQPQKETPEERAARMQLDLASRTANRQRAQQDIRAVHKGLSGKTMARFARQNDKSLAPEHLDAIERIGDIMGGRNLSPATSKDLELIDDALEGLGLTADAEGKEVDTFKSRTSAGREVSKFRKELIAFKQRFVRDSRKDLAAGISEFNERVARENPESREDLFAIADEVAKRHPLSASGLIEYASDPKNISEGVTHSEKLKRELDIKPTTGRMTTEEYLDRRRGAAAIRLDTERKKIPIQIDLLKKELSAKDDVNKRRELRALEDRKEFLDYGIDKKDTSFVKREQERARIALEGMDAVLAKQGNATMDVYIRKLEADLEDAPERDALIIRRNLEIARQKKVLGTESLSDERDRMARELGYFKDEMAVRAGFVKGAYINKLGMKSEAVYLERQSEYRTYLRNDLGYDDAAVESIIRDIDSADPDERKAFEDYLNTQKTIDDTRKERADKQSRQRVLFGKPDISNEGDVNTLVEEGNLRSEYVKGLKIEIPEPTTGVATFRLSQTVKGGQSSIGKGGEDMLDLMAAGKTAMEAAASVVAGMEDAGTVPQEGLNDAGREEVKRRVMTEAKRISEQAAEDSTATVRQLREERLGTMQARVKNIIVDTSPDAWGKEYRDGATAEADGGQIIDITQTAIDYVREHSAYNSMSPDEKDYFDDAVVAFDSNDEVKNSAYFLPVTGKIMQVQTMLEAYAGLKDEQDVIEQEKENDKRVKEAATIQFNKDRGLMTAVEYDAEGNPDHKKFSLNDQREIEMYYDYIAAGDTEKAAILSRQRALIKLKTDANTEAQKQIATMNQGLITIRRVKTTGLGTKYIKDTIPWEPRSERDWDDYMQRMRGDLSVSPEAYDAWYSEAEKLKKAWTERGIDELVKADTKVGRGVEHMTRDEAAVLMNEIANADAEWVTKTTLGKKGDVKTATVDIIGKKEDVSAFDKNELIRDTRFLPKEQIPSEADIPDRYRFNTVKDAQAAEAEGTIPDQTFVWVAGKPQLFTKE